MSHSRCCRRLAPSRALFSMLEPLALVSLGVPPLLLSLMKSFWQLFCTVFKLFLFFLLRELLEGLGPYEIFITLN
jgi:hypothetical protein